MPNNDIQQLKILKEKLNNQKMSVLVGAGFSKNVSDIFPSWWQLLFDMTYFLFQTEIEDAFYDVKKSKSTFSKNEFIKNKISYYISKIGYLDIVSEYIKRKGYREAITSYIEEKTPKITGAGKNYYLENCLGENKNRVKIKEEMLSQHKLLLELPWNNIYTTNYDELLEFSNDSSNAESIASEIQTIESEIQLLQKEKSDYHSKSDRLKKEFDSITKKIEGLNKNEKNLNNPEISELKDQLEKNLNNPERIDLEVQLEKNQTEKRKHEIELGGVKRRITDKERELLQLKKAQNECISLVISSEDLSIKRNKNIIKLHGSLRREGSRYGFDGDIQKQYVIAREDYESYPSKHEAFTQLMRISLLQESYCLIGFSGDDTNFLEWIKWVREILERGKNNNDYKIYLISVNTSPITADKQLFFENHKVYPIPIMREEVIDFMETHTGNKLKKRTYKSVIELFFKYLKGRHQINISKSTFEILQHNKYKRSWDSIDLLKPQEVDFARIGSSSKKIGELKKYSRLPSLNFAYSSRKHNLLFYSKALIESVTSKQKNALLTLIILAIKDSYLTPKDFVWDKADLKKIEDSFNKSSKSVQKQYLKLMLRDWALRKDAKSFKDIENKLSKKSDDNIYESILFSAFSLDFKSLKIKIESWKPKSDWAIKKSGLLALFDSQIAQQHISSQLGNPLTSCQDELYRLEMYRYLKQSVEFGFDKDLNEAISRYKHLGLTSVSENIDYLIEEANKNKDKIKRYGEGRFSISNEFIFSNDFTLSQKGLQFIQQIIESGFPLSIANINWKNPKDCYPLFKGIFQYFPYPVIFYSLQFSDEKFLRRIGQDFAFSEKLQDNLDEILKTLLTSYLDENTPNHFKQSILYFSSELFIATDPNSWQDLFLKIWEIDSFRKNCLEDRWFAERTLANSCLPYIQEPKIITKLINSILANPDSNYSVELLYHLAKNNRLEKLGDNLQSQELTDAIESTIKSIHKNEMAIFMIGNIYSILTDLQKNLVFVNLENLEFDNIKNKRLWSVLTYFCDGNKKIINRLKSAIIRNKKIFNTGFTDKGLSMGVDFIEISRLTNLENSKHIKWTKTEAIQIFKKIVLELKKIEDWLAKREHNFTSILHEMLLFLESERSKIEGEKEYQAVFDKIQKLYSEHRGYDSLLDGLVSTDSNVVVWALSQLSILLHQGKSIEGFNFEVATLLNKVLLQSDPSLEASLNYLAAWINSENLSEAFREHAVTILSILKKYTRIELVEFDKPFVYKQLVDIASALNSWKIQDEVIDQWLTFEKETSFNNIKFREIKEL